MIAVGSLLLLNSFGVVRVRFWELFWPLVIVFLGTRLIMQTPGRRRERHRLRSMDLVPTRIPSGLIDGRWHDQHDVRPRRHAADEQRQSRFRGGRRRYVLNLARLAKIEMSLQPTAGLRCCVTGLELPISRTGYARLKELLWTVPTRLA